MNEAHTIFALSSAAGRAGIAVIRISGAYAGNILRVLSGKKHLPEPRRAARAHLHDPATNRLIDDALVLWFPHPASFTGENVVELHVHGGHAIIQALLHILSGFPGMRMAEPGEFARRAFSNGKIDLTQAEGLADLINAETALQHRQALRQMQGEFKRQCDAWRHQLLGMLAQMEAYIDFPDEDLPASLRDDFLAHAFTLKKQLAAHLSAQHGERMREGVRVAILGAPNVGKSTLFNYLAKRDIAIVSSIAGTTRDVLEAHLDIGGYPVIVSDAAGLREAGDAIETEGIRRARANAENASIRLCLFDAAALPDLDAETSLFMHAYSIAVLSRSDLKLEYESIPKRIGDQSPIVFSAATGEGGAELINALKASLDSLFIQEAQGGALITRARHRQALLRCHEHLESFIHAAEAKKPIELCAEEMRRAMRDLGAITGHAGAEEVLGEIFSRFCIGK